MKQLFEIDLHDYKETDRVFSRPSARGIIIREQKLALVYSPKEKYYKFPGGGIREGEDAKAALIREVREEVGLIVIPDSVREFGSVMRRQKSNYAPDTIFEQENFYFFCRTENRTVPQELDLYEQEAAFVLQYTDMEQAIQTNQNYHSSSYFDEIMVMRECRVLQMVEEILRNHT